MQFDIRSPSPLRRRSILLRTTTHDLDFVRMDTRIVHLKRHVLDQKGPYFIAEAVGVEMSLYHLSSVPLTLSLPSPSSHPYLERHPRLHLVLQHLCNAAIEVAQDLHRKLRLDAALSDQLVEGIHQSPPDTTKASR